MAAHVHLLLRFPDEKTYINTDNLAKLIGGTRLKGSLVQWGPVIDIQQVGDDMNRQIVDLPANKVAPLGDGERLLRYMTKSIRDGLVQDVADIDGLTESERKKVGLYRMWVQRTVDGLPLFDEVNPSECCPVHGAIANVRFVEPFKVFRPSEKERQRKGGRLRQQACLRLSMNPPSRSRKLLPIKRKRGNVARWCGANVVYARESSRKSPENTNEITVLAHDCGATHVTGAS